MRCLIFNQISFALADALDDIQIDIQKMIDEDLVYASL